VSEFNALLAGVNGEVTLALETLDNNDGAGIFDLLTVSSVDVNAAADAREGRNNPWGSACQLRALQYKQYSSPIGTFDPICVAGSANNLGAVSTAMLKRELQVSDFLSVYNQLQVDAESTLGTTPKSAMTLDAGDSMQEIPNNWELKEAVIQQQLLGTVEDKHMKYWEETSTISDKVQEARDAECPAQGVFDLMRNKIVPFMEATLRDSVSTEITFMSIITDMSSLGLLAPGQLTLINKMNTWQSNNQDIINAFEAIGEDAADALESGAEDAQDEADAEAGTERGKVEYFATAATDTVSNWEQYATDGHMSNYDIRRQFQMKTDENGEQVRRDHPYAPAQYFEQNFRRSWANRGRTFTPQMSYPMYKA